jgi:hypothetical protein
MDELENHLLEEIDDLKKYEGISEEEAFQKVVSVIGGREVLDKEFVKSKPPGAKAVHWVKTHSLQIYSTLLLLIIFLVSDLVYSSLNFVDVYEPVTGKYYYYANSNGNSYRSMVPFSEIKKEFHFLAIPESSKSLEFPNSGVNKLEEYSITFKVADENGKEVDLNNNFSMKIDNINIVYDSILMKPTIPYPFKLLEESDIWDLESQYKMNSNPILLCTAVVFKAKYHFLLDDKNQLWLAHYSKFSINSPRITLKTQFLQNNNILFNRKYLEQETKLYTYIDFPQRLEDANFLFFKAIDPYQALLYQKEKDQIRTIRLQLLKLSNQKYPILFWDEVKLVQKPIHLWNLLFQNISNNK